ncbi:MAG: ATP-binding cassette domain-containing protein [Clostridia bacterium]|nr:ATP-binding cassette domain-containing protein [Clostridia bacterium]
MADIFTINNLQMYYPIKKGFTKKLIGHVKAVNNVSLTIHEGETLGVVGESGCGKSTLGNCIIRLINPTGGEIIYHRENGESINLVGMPDKELKFYRKEAQLIFQDPYSSLNPRKTVRDLVGEPLLVNDICDKSEINNRVGTMLRRVGLRAEYMKRYPHAFSGGQRQRISIARALIMRPRFVICDEAVSALDVSVQAQVIELLRDLQAEYKNTYLFISHDLSVVKHISDRIMVMYMGRVVEMCESDELFRNTLHPYAKALIDAVPDVDKTRHKTPNVVKGEVGDATKDIPGCAFAPRCKYATDICLKEHPPLVNAGGEGDQEHWVCCHNRLG